MPTLTLPRLLVLSVVLRLGLFFHGLHQDATSTLKYTDIDYYVFTDAARSLSQGDSPYARETYRYTPLLAYMLLPSTWEGCFSFGKLLFAVSDIIAGWGIYRILLQTRGVTERQALLYSATCWLLNPMVATISTRGSSEGLLGVMVICMLWAAVSQKTILTGVLLGLATHFKIYPVIYAPAILLSMGGPLTLSSLLSGEFITLKRVMFGVSALGTFVALNLAMYNVYGHEFLHHTYLYHFIRSDHRHNFSPYNMLLYLVSSPSGYSEMPFTKWAFLPQMLLSAVIIPLVGARKDLAGTMFAQTFAFVAFNKVCTSQYFMWYIVLLPFLLPYSSLLRDWKKGLLALGLWIVGQAAWLQQGYELEFLGNSTFFPGLWMASLGFFMVNCWLLGIFVDDVAQSSR
ncbi:PIG-M-domain-containing protein [Pyronema domesticum]|uniref:GPI mannosyltransferase 1 n=1 Tax=Pyronema omphalodes (strain CBS 100304) TaxID=1076935 RepID=U4LQF2_PYROM|nr:PIG-M-domain-containing protein [Pyronema domesticum]CCX29536.1 Similar to GPI mannosyltransferase 1; acc. no. Q4I073 [Pyronema omphalodes CBS 100304]